MSPNPHYPPPPSLSPPLAFTQVLSVSMDYAYIHICSLATLLQSLPLPSPLRNLSVCSIYPCSDPILFIRSLLFSFLPSSLSPFLFPCKYWIPDIDLITGLRALRSIMSLSSPSSCGHGRAHLSRILSLDSSPRPAGIHCCLCLLILFLKHKTAFLLSKLNHQSPQMPVLLPDIKLPFVRDVKVNSFFSFHSNKVCEQLVNMDMWTTPYSLLYSKLR